MGIFHNHDPIFFYHKSSKSSTDNAFGGVVTPSATIAVVVAGAVTTYKEWLKGC
jgi:hypothetical protein